MLVDGGNEFVMKQLRNLLLLFAFLYLLPQCVAQGKPRETPRETLCTRDGFVIYNGMTVGFKKLSPNRYSFIDLTYSRGPRTIYGECYIYVEGTWEQPKRKQIYLGNLSETPFTSSITSLDSLFLTRYRIRDSPKETL